MHSINSIHSLHESIRMVFFANLVIFIYITIIVFHITIYHQQLLIKLEDKYKIYINLEDENIPITFLTFLICIAFILLMIIIILIAYFIETTPQNNDYINIYINQLIQDNIKLSEVLNNTEIPLHVSNIYINHCLKTKDNDICSICLGKMKQNDDLYLTFCGHLYHGECFDLSQEFSNKCAMCREDLSYYIYEDIEN